MIDLYPEDKVSKLVKKVSQLEKTVARLVAIEANRQREFEINEEFERLRDEVSTEDKTFLL